MASKPAFRGPFRQSRCLIVADGFYEWKKVEGSKKKQPYHITLKDGNPFAFAGLYAHWAKGEKPIDSCTILTTDANDMMRAPVESWPVGVEVLAGPRWRSGAEQCDRLVGSGFNQYPQK